MVMVARVQFAFTAMFHMLFPVLTIGLAIFLIVMEAFWLKTYKESYYHHCRFWGRVFLLNFALGVVTGAVMEFQFGTNWSIFSRGVGSFFGNLIGFEAAMAFALEAAFLAIMSYGWNRVSAGIHMLATCLVGFGAVLSAFWIMDSNSWMQTPAGTEMKGGSVVIHDYVQALFNPAMVPSFVHMLLACFMVGLFMVGGISAWYIRKRRHTDFFLSSFRMALVAAFFFAPLQIWAGDWSGRMVAKNQPAKTAGMEALWETNPPGKGAPFSFIAWPDWKEERNAFAVRVPYLLSLLSTHSLTGTVQGLRDFPPEDRPYVILPFYTFRIMVGIGFLLFFLMLWTLYEWWRGYLSAARAPARKWLLRSWVMAAPLSYIAVEAGWTVREVGRQPWIVYGMMRTAEGVSPIGLGAVIWSLSAYAIIYTLLFVLLLLFGARIIRQGPQLDAEPPSRQRKYKAAGQVPRYLWILAVLALFFFLAVKPKRN